MTERDEPGFSWQSLFWVTGFSGLGFDLAIKFLDGHHSPVFLWTGIISLALGLINILLQFFIRRASNKNES